MVVRRGWPGPGGRGRIPAGSGRPAARAPTGVYTAAWRRLHGCLQRYDACVPGQAVNRAHDHRLTGQPIEQPDLMFQLGAFVTVDDARRQLQLYAADRRCPAGRPLTDRAGITEALDRPVHSIETIASGAA